jgi:hypothetical protein
MKADCAKTLKTPLAHLERTPMSHYTKFELEFTQNLQIRMRKFE